MGVLERWELRGVWRLEALALGLAFEVLEDL